MGGESMTSIAERVLNRKWAALVAVSFCGYLTVATSENVPATCPPEESTTLERTFTSGEELRSWKLTAVGAIEITSWHIQVTPAVSLTYVPPSDTEVTVIFDPAVEAVSDAGAHTGTDDASAPIDASSSPQEFPPNHVLVGEGTLTVVCGGDPSLCDDVRFEVALGESDAKAFTLEANALRSNCASSGAITDLRLEPVNP